MSFLFNHIPNDDEGKLFIKQLRKYINRDLVKGVRARGRGSRKEHGNAYGISQKYAERLHLYFDYQEENESIENIDLAYETKRKLEKITQSLNFVSRHQYLYSMINEEIESLKTLIDMQSKYKDQDWFHFSAPWGMRSKIKGLEELLELIEDPFDD